MSEMWATFARTGHPGAKGQPVWPAYTLAEARHHDDRYAVQG